MNKKKYPDKLRLTFVDRGAGEILGFANVYEPNTKAYAKREETQNKWAYGSYIVRNGKFIKTTYKYNHNSVGGYDREDIEIEVDDSLQPIIIDNVPMEGFRIMRSVSRYGTSNKVWRVKDPRGFELEIATDTFEDIIMDGIVDEGVILGKCIWRTGKILERYKA